jgi:hypothetical protein
MKLTNLGASFMYPSCSCSFSSRYSCRHWQGWQKLAARSVMKLRRVTSIKQDTTPLILAKKICVLKALSIAGMSEYNCSSVEFYPSHCSQSKRWTVLSLSSKTELPMESLVAPYKCSKHATLKCGYGYDPDQQARGDRKNWRELLSTWTRQLKMHFENPKYFQLFFKCCGKSFIQLNLRRIRKIEVANDRRKELNTYVLPARYPRSSSSG